MAILPADQADAMARAYNVLMDTPDAHDIVMTWAAEDREALSAAYGTLLIASREKV